MKRLLVACLLCVGFSVSAQQHPTANTQCQQQVEDILSSQWFDIDDPISEDARNILFEMYEKLNLIYVTPQNDPSLVQYVNEFQDALEEADQLNLNISMFQDDINYVDTLNFRMKTLRLFASFAIAIGFTQASYAQCGATSVDPSPQVTGNCEGETDTISFSAAGNCSGWYEYQVEGPGPVVLQPWSNNAQFIVAPSATTTYTVYARCTACVNTVVSDTFLIEVIPAPVITADTFVCHGTAAQFTATGPTGNMSWYDAPGGTELSPNENYTTPPLTSDQSYVMEVTGTVTSGATQGSVLITECGLGGFQGSSSADYVEVSNLYSTAVNTAGWVVALSNSYTNINSVNTILWNLPTTFQACSIESRSDVAAGTFTPYWGNNIFWNPGSNGWALILDDTGNLVDFVAWGWTTAEIAGFNTNINGFNVTVGPEWLGGSIPSACGSNSTGVTPQSISRVGTNDSNTAADFICQNTSLNVLNPALSCGWTTSTVGCYYPVNVVVDMPPSASNPATTSVACYSDVPVADPTVVIDELDDHTAVPTVQFMGEVSDGLSCPETLTRTYRVTDSCSNWIEVTHDIRIFDSIAPVMDPAPADLSVSCYADVPPMAGLNWTDNCLGAGVAAGSEVSSGTTCPETLTRTWTITDTCGNSVTETQTIVINDTQAPVIDPAPADLAVSCSSDVPAMAALNWTDNCSGSGVLNGVEVSDGQSCPETITRTWTFTDNCGNSATETQVIVVNDITPPTASPLPAEVVGVLPPPDVSLLSDAADNCGTPNIVWVDDVSDNGFCPENVVRTYSITDDCGNELIVTQDFQVGDNIPLVSFTASETILTNANPDGGGIIYFSNTSSGAETYLWDFDDSTTSTDYSTSHTFDNSTAGGYYVTLYGFSEYGCVDSASIAIQVRVELLYYIPNTFTPDGDEFNQTFQPIFESGFDSHDWNMTIYNRWGQVVFESNDHTVGWDGTYGGKMVPQGTYSYKIEFGLEYTDARE
eukprot:CAMPEP_0185567978 /NCGR_PEP_ID=MMETSP0434-20130131/1083_1 /TAXON_ID=626734 ORGANISM="Favella taraikaensis, Strain Fe Narragansett Bay" /NCGR_SAMPLE_ID=MMETSP0434 /ASSEMBLY_ACC=CAM_ASM_000379 /LENGTH=985 /DNA_ID=CAMNT_0028182345 /DNA_START=32 /DNA_END=2987 /DNA_ORIENTATION=+